MYVSIIHYKFRLKLLHKCFKIISLLLKRVVMMQKKCLKIIPETPFTYYGQKFYFTITFSTLFPAFTMYKPGATFVVALAEIVEMPLSVVIV